MKTILLLFLFAVSTSFAQTYTEKYNEYLERYEYKNSNGDLVGYKKWNSYKGQYEYTEVQTTNNYYNRKPIELMPVTSSYDFKLINRALSTKQNNYNANFNKLKNYVNSLREAIRNLEFDNAVIHKISNRFEQSVTVVNKNGYDYSSDATTTKVGQFLYDILESTINEERNRIVVNEQPLKTQTTISSTPKKINLYVKINGIGYIWDSINLATSKSLGQVSHKEVYVIEKVNETYYKVKYNNIVGYMTGSNLYQ